MDIQPVPATLSRVAGTQAPAAHILVRADPMPAPAREIPAQAVPSIDHAMSVMSRDLEFTPDPGTHKVVIRVVDRQSGQVIRQFPSEEALAIARDIDRQRELMQRQPD